MIKIRPHQDTDRQTRCDICGCTRHALWLRKYDLDYLSCHDCGFIYTNLAQLDRNAYNRQNNEKLRAHYIDKQYSHARQQRYTRQLKQFQRFGTNQNQKQNTPKDVRDITGHLLEIGSSAGGFLYCAAALGWQAIGVEPVADIASYGIETHGLDIRKCTLTEAGLCANYFDVIYCNAVLEHLPSPRRTLAEAYRLLRPGGVFFADTINIDSYTFRNLGKAWRLLDPRAHLSLFTPKILKQILRQTGFGIIRFSSHGVRFNSYRGSRRWNFRRLLAEIQKAPYSLAARVFLKGDSIAVRAQKPSRRGTK